MSGNNQQSGFTLLEVLVAIAIFAMVAMISYTTLDTYLDQRERLTQHYGKLERLQRLFIMLERDIQYIINREIRRDGGDDRVPAVMSAEGDAFITMTVAVPDLNNKTGVALKRVQWRLEDKKMIRAEWEVLDQTGNVEPSELVIGDEIEDIELNYLFYDARGGVNTDSSLGSGQFPDGIEVNIQLATGESYRRIYAVARGA